MPPPLNFLLGTNRQRMARFEHRKEHITAVFTPPMWRMLAAGCAAHRGVKYKRHRHSEG